MRPSSMIFALLLFSTSLSAQTSSGNKPTVLVQPPVSRGCPVLLSVNRIGDGAVVRTNNVLVPRRQGLTLTFRGPSAQIVAADVTVNFYPSSVRAIPAAPARNEHTESPQIFHLGSTSGPMLHSSIWTEYIAPVSWVELTRVEFADGTVWKSTTPRQCGAAPSLFVPVGTAR